MSQEDHKIAADTVISNENEPECFISEFFFLYKNSGKESVLTQQQRRDVLLREQKEKRHKLVDNHRDFTELFFEDESQQFEETYYENACSEVSESMDTDVPNSFHKKRRNKFALMQSEWFTEVPSDLEDNWLTKLVPDGIRVLVIAKKFQTTILNERGKVLTLKTYLPGGGLSGVRGLTVLDCIYHKLSKTIFVLDCLHWNTMSMIDSETAFRFYWLKNQFEENNKLLETNKPYRFHVLEFFLASKSLIQEKIFSKLGNFMPQIFYNGIVFYHKELNYTFQQTPLFGWLYSYMLPEKLQIDVPQELLNRMPKNYECLEKYVKTLEEKKEKKQRHFFRDKRHEKHLMDTS